MANTQASAVVLDPKTGAILAMYSTPTYDPNPLVSQDGKAVEAAYQADIHAPGNPVLAKAYEDTNAPGSTFKVVTSSAVYDHDPSVANINYPVGELPTGRDHPDTSQQLCNYGQGAETVRRYPATDAAGVVRHRLRPDGAGYRCPGPEQRGGGVRVQPGAATRPARGGQVELSLGRRSVPAAFLAYSAFGQENVTASALQMAMVAGAIADKGVIMTPHVMAQIRDSQGDLVQILYAEAVVNGDVVLDGEPGPVLDAGRGHERIRGGSLTVSFRPTRQWRRRPEPRRSAATPSTRADWMIAYSTSDPNVAVAVVAPYQASKPPAPQSSGPVTCAILQAALNSTETCPGG